MKTLTIHPVWAWAIIHGHKRVENRRWRTRYRGPLLIHASADTPAARRSDAAARVQLAALGIDVPEIVPSAAIVGRVRLLDVRARDAGSLFPDALASDPLARGPWCWLLADPIVFDSPLAARGLPGLWEHKPA